ncbi:C40 family peptidase [Cohnella fermenti]|uniref:Permuted papain-like amidase YaeF/Yiix C92 family enzyme n=1 Tax=Cohnella fermenti TaxID=2565925 RepID=A0A4S4BGN4_9BACL|nr:hypothetical protein [Cohnella fermenti]THF73614.1 hypothetical protein E6C55_28445 [Cohnella fermenti]
MIPAISRSDKPIYVLLTHTGTLFTTLIRGVTSAPYNHASLAMDAELSRLYSFGRKRPRNPLSAGFVEEDVYEGTFSRYPNTRCALLRLRVTDEQRAEAWGTIRAFQQNRDDYRYNLIGLLGVLMNRDLCRKNAYFCSQFVAEALRRSGIPLWDRSSALVTPDDFLRHGSFELVYEGNLYDYPLLDVKRIAARSAGTAVRTRANPDGSIALS